MKKIENNNINEEPNLNRLGFSIVLLVAFISSVTAIVKDDVKKVLSQESPIGSSDTTTMNPLSYNPPNQYGKIVKTKFNLGAKKTIIYIVDSHPLTMDDETSLNVQKDLYFIYKDYIKKYGQLPMVVENWPVGAKAQDFNLSHFANDYDPNAGNSILRSLIKEDNIVKREQIAEESLGSNLLPAAMTAMFVYPELDTIGSVSRFDLENLDRNMKDMAFLQLAVDYPSQFPCNEENTFTLADAEYSLKNGVQSNLAVECYCGIRAYLEHVIPNFMNDRFYEAPAKEINAAIKHDSDVVMVVAGANHLPASLSLMDKNNLNYVVVAPRSFETAVPMTSQDLPKIKNIPQIGRVCEAFGKGVK